MKFIDLNRQYSVIGSDIERRIKSVLDSKKFIMGEEIAELENKLATFVGRKYAFTCSSGTSALTIPLMTYHLTKKDAIFVPSFTFFASAESINLAGATPVFIDSDNTFNMNPKKLEEAILSTIQKGELVPKGIIAVDIFGLPADYDEIIAIAKKYNLFLIEDAAQSFGAVYNNKRSCSFGDISATSFFPAKPLGCYGDGGAIFTDDDELAKQIVSIRVHGQGADRYDNIQIGINGRMDTIQAAILLAKMEVFERELQTRQVIAKLYSENLKNDFIIPTFLSNKISAWAQFSLLAKNKEQRDQIILGMKEYDIPIMVYYAIPMHLQTAYQYLCYKKGALPVCEDFADRVFSVPMHPYLKRDEIEVICDKLRLFC